MMLNAKKELLEVIPEGTKIKCAIVNKHLLKVGYTEDEFEDFLNLLDFKYNNGYGGQNLYGAVWLEDGTWLDRGEYDGSEWWEHIVMPEIPRELMK